ncbi:MAG: hypothetical protein M3291_09885 [Actinomycetota bacterium]|nr:hypothetical protein [Actinomycetota bacterium]
MIIVPTPVPGAEASAGRADTAPPGSVLRGFSGALAAGLVVLTLVLAVAQWLSTQWLSTQWLSTQWLSTQWLSGPATVPGPGVGTLVGHGVGALIALLLQWVADRSSGGRAVTASLAVLSVVAAVLWFWWWR